MKKSMCAALLCTAFFLAACSSPDPANPPTLAQTPQPEEQAPPPELPPVSTAATPGLKSENHLERADEIFDQAKAAIKALDLGSEAGGKEFRIDNPNLVFVCQYSPGGGTSEEVPLLVCRFAVAYNSMTGHALFWHDGTDWQAQLYPQAPPDAAQQRLAYFESLGANCPIGCGSEFRALRQAGTEALVVVDLSGVGTRSNQEVHLVAREGKQWRLLWVPNVHDFRFTALPPVTRQPNVALAAHGIDEFTVSYDDGVSDIWIRQGTGYVRKDP